MTSAPPVQDRAKMIEDFVKELVVDRDFKLDERGDIATIRNLHVSKCTVPLLRRICVRFKVSGYKNQSKECTLGLLKNLVMRESLKNSMYDDSASCSSESSSQEGAPPVPRPPKSKSTNKKSSAAEKETSSTVLSPGQSSTSTTTSDHDDAPGNNDSLEEEFHDAEQEELSCSSNEDATRASLTSRSQKKRKVTVTTNNGADLSVSKTRGNTTRRKKKKAKGTAPDAVTCINTYFCVINVYICQKNRSLVMDLGRPPTKANLDSRTSPHRHVYEALLSQYLDEENDNAASMFAFPDHVFWTLTGVRLDVAFSEFDTALTAANDIAAILGYINHHY